MIHQPFSFIDWAVLLAYFAIVLLIGVIYRSGREGVLDYFFARGQMPWWAVGLGLIATSVSASTFLGNPAEAYQFDIRRQSFYTRTFFCFPFYRSPFGNFFIGSRHRACGRVGSIHRRGRRHDCAGNCNPGPEITGFLAVVSCNIDVHNNRHRSDSEYFCAPRKGSGNNMKRLKILLVTSLMFVFLNGCAKDLISGKTTLNYYDIGKEPKIGAYVLGTQTKELKAKGKRMDTEADPVEYERIKRITSDIASVSHHTDFPFEAHLADIDVVNAWCAPGGKMMVYTGLWDSQKGLVEKGNDDQLAAVISHEVAHATARHVTESLSRNITIMLVGAAVQSAIAVGGSAEGANLFGQIFSDGMNLYIPSYSRKNELEADRIGLIYMSKAGYDPREAVALWEKAAKKKKDKTSLYASHPASGARAEALKKNLPEAMQFYEEAIAKKPKEIQQPKKTKKKE